MSRAARCPCGAACCHDWHVEPEATVHGVNFTEEQARTVAAVLSGTAVVVLCDDRADAASTAECINYLTPHISEARVLSRPE